MAKQSPLTVDEALARVLELAEPCPPLRVPLIDSLGLTLAEDVASDVDSPPHDKSLVDGYAVRAADFVAGEATLEVLEQVTAGEVPTLPVATGQTTRIMTGAPLPEGADAVAMIERSEEAAHAVASNGRVRVVIRDAKLEPGANILRQAASMRRGDLVLRAGKKLRAIELGLLAEVGCAQPLVLRPPQVFVLATGNELVAVDEWPGPGQIRNSNSPLLTALVERAGGVASDAGVARDNLDDLNHCVERGLSGDVLVLSGGVSAGVLDLAPGVLTAHGVRQVFHKVQLKPGHPLWFGICRHHGRTTLVFGLPGNPVSSLVCFELFVRPALEMMTGRLTTPLVDGAAILAAPFTQKSDRPTYYPAQLDAAGAWPLAWRGSADLRALANADTLLYFPPGPRTYAAGESVATRSLLT